MNVRWFHIAAANVPACISDAEPRHIEETGPNSALSVTWNVAGTEAIIKVNGASRTWRENKTWISTRLGIWDRDDFHTIFNAIGFYTAAWQEEE